MNSPRPLIILLLTTLASCQVQVSVVPSKTGYLVGEPILAVVHVTNIGPDPVGYSTCDGQVVLNIEKQPHRQVANVWGCFMGMGSGSACGIDHPPVLPPGKSTDFRYLLRDYQLGPGEYLLRVSGKAGVRWKFSSDLSTSNSSDPRVSEFHEGDPVPGEHFDQAITLTVRAGTEAELEKAFEPYVDAAENGDLFTSYPARDAIAEMAPAFLEEKIKGFAGNPDTQLLAAKGLGRIDTAESRADLVDLFDKSSDLHFRESIVYTLARMNSSDQIPFLTSLLPGHSSENDDRIREGAALAIGRVGGDGGVDQLASFLSSSGSKASPRLQSVIAVALASGKSRKAVPVLINLYRDNDGQVRDSVCGSLESLTHRNWCIRAPGQPDYQTSWPEWWRRNAATTMLYGFDQCLTYGKAKPLD